MRDDWWQLVLATPIAVVIGSALVRGSFGVLLSFAFVIPYPYAIRKDAKYVNANAESEVMNVRLVTILGILVLLTLGILSYVVSPYYLYHRRRRLPS